MFVKHVGVLGRAAVTAVTTTLALVTFAGIASAHLEPVPDRAVKGKTASVTFKVPNERPDAGTVKVGLELPADFPLLSVRVRTTPGWTAEVVKGKLDKPVKSGNTEITEAFRTITWTAASGTRIGPGEFAEFAVTFGPMPANTDKFMINAVQTYDSGEVVNWNQPPPADGGAEPEHPAPVITLTAGDALGSSSEHGGSQPVAAPAAMNNSAVWLGGSALALSALALGIAVGLTLRLRRSSGGSA